MSPDLLVESVAPRDPQFIALVEELTAELAQGGYADSESFGYSVEELERDAVHLVGAHVAGRLVGIGGVELAGDGIGELKRFFVAPGHRGAGIADAVLVRLVEHARDQGAHLLRLETGDQQHAAIRFYRRHGFVEIPRFGPYVDSATSVCVQRDLRAS